MAANRRRNSGGKKRGTTLRDLLDEALENHHAGRASDAEAICRRILEVRPEQPQALYLYGVSIHQTRRDPGAVSALERAIRFKPDFAEAHNAVGVILRQQGDLEGALVAHRKALEIAPDMAAAHQGLAASLLAAGRGDAAFAAYEEATRRAPDSVSLAAEIASALRHVGRPEEALAIARETATRLPDSAEAHGLLAEHLHHDGRLDDATASHRRAVSLAPKSAVAHTNLGVTLHAAGDLEGAAASHATAVSLAPKNARAHHNRALVLLELNRLDESIRAARAALSTSPTDADLHWDLALALLSAGELREGWQEFEWRWRAPGFAAPERHTDHPLWDGSALDGRRLLVHAEQGLGDTIQFLRYLPLLCRGGARVVLECPPELHRLARGVAGVEQVIARAESPGAFDVQIPLLSVPRIFGTTLRSIPAQVPYLRPDAADEAHWARALGESSGLRVGVVWAGSATHRNDHNRSIAPERLEPLLSIPGVHGFSLQVGDRADPAPPGVTKLVPKLADFADTAAAIATLDLVISVDTAVAHLAGALGRPVWVLLPHAPDWRWMRDRDDSPWYPTMRLFRQTERGGWESVIARVAQELMHCVGTEGPGREP